MAGHKNCGLVINLLFHKSSGQIASPPPAASYYTLRNHSCGLEGPLGKKRMGGGCRDKAHSAKTALFPEQTQASSVARINQSGFSDSVLNLSPPWHPILFLRIPLKKS